MRRTIAGICLPLLLSAASLAQPEGDDKVVRVVFPAERIASLAEHTKEHLGAFDTRDPAIPLDEFFSPGSRPDPLAALVSPRRVPAADAAFPKQDSVVVEVVVDGQAVAYPLGVLTYHGVINDVIAGAPIAVWFDPISSGLAVFRRDPIPVRGDVVAPGEFRLAGLLVRGSAALYDKDTKALFSPLDGVGATGAYSGASLEFLPFRVTSMQDFVKVRPDGEVLAEPPGDRFDYGVNPFAEYQGDPNLVFVKATDDLRLAPKVRGVGVASGDDAYFIPFGAMLDESRRVMTLGGAFEASLTPDRTLYVREAPPGAVVAQSYYANWVAAHPSSKIIMAVDLRDLSGEAP